MFASSISGELDASRLLSMVLSTPCPDSDSVSAAVEPGKVGDVKKVAIRENGVQITYIGDARLPQSPSPYLGPA